MPGDLPEDLDLDDMALSSGEEEESSGSEAEEEDEDEDMEDFDLEQETVASLFYRSYHPEFMDLCTEFADSEEFLIDGDALLRQTLAKEGVARGSPRLSTLHIVSLLERSLANFTDRGGEFNIVFFKNNQRRWEAGAMLLLRTAVILHLRENTNLTVFTEFADPFDIEFQQYVETEKPSFFLSSAAKDDLQDAVYFLEVKNLGVNFADIFGVDKTLVQIFCWYSLVQPSSEAVARHVRKLHGQWLEEQVVVPEQPLPTLAPSSPLHLAVVGEVQGAGEAVVAAALLVAATLQRHLGLLERVEGGVHLLLPTSSPLPALLDTVATALLRHIHLAAPTLLPDLLDTQHLLSTLLRLSSSTSLLTTFSEEVARLPALATDLEAIKEQVDLTKFAALEEVVGQVERVEVEVEEVRGELVTIDNPLYNTYTKGVGEGEGGAAFLAGQQAAQFEEQFGWATTAKLSDDYDRTPGNKKGKSFFEMKGAQKAASFMVRYGTSIEGGIESDKPLAVVKKGGKPDKKEDPNKKSAKGVQIQRENIMKRFKESQEDLMKKYKGLKEDATDDKVAECADLFEKKYREIRKDIEQVGEVKLNKKEKKGAKEDTLDADVKAFFEKNLVKIYLKVLKTVMSVIKHGKEERERVGAVVQAMLTFKKLAAMEQSSEEKTAETLRKYILEIGFVNLAKELKMVKEKEAVDVKAERSFARFQLEHMGQHLDHEAPAERDRRVDKFNPDMWQRQLFDVVDHRESALIIAPTSSGKTYASYYTMETVLRESDEGTVVYVAPTKALVNQVSATVCARFSKRKMDLPPGRVVQGTFTRDFKENALNCQILVTVPECLEILLLSPERNAWAKSLRYVIFDEVHNIGAETRGETWEHIITLIRCPFLALSATVANPDTLHSWLQRAERYKMERDVSDGCKEGRSYEVRLVPSAGNRIERHADLKKQVYRAAADTTPAGLHALHPIAALKPSVLRKTRSIPGHVTMSPSECLELFLALEAALGQAATAHVEPTRVLGENFLKKAAVSDYNQLLKTFFLEQFMADESVLEKLRATLKSSGNHSESSTEEDGQLTREAKYIYDQFPALVQHLKESNKLPAIVFSFNREYCNGLTKLQCDHYEQKIEDLKMSDKYADKQKAKDKEEAANAKKEKKLQAKMDKIESKQGGDEGGRRKNQNAKDENEALMELNRIFKEFPEFTLVARNTLGDDDAEYIYNNLLTTDPLFQAAMKYGISWHHAGNNAKMRNAAEMLFREKFLNVVVATTTLAQGIHMPCKTVVFAGDSVFLNSLNYHQCAGRAGRRGFDADGNVIFFGIKRSKISRLLTSNLPKLIGNNPTCLSLILRLFMMTAGHQKEEVRQDAISRALCLLENPLITSFQPDISPRLKFYFMHCTEYLVKQGLLDTKGDPVGFAGLASHLHTHEPYNLAFCHLLQAGALHTVCRKTEQGDITEDSMRALLILLNFLFGRMKLNIPSYQARRETFTNSKVLLPPMLPQFKACLEEFNNTIDSNFATYLSSAARHYKEEGEAELPLSGLRYGLGPASLGPAYNMLSPFACLAGKDNRAVGKAEIQVIDSNVRPALLADTVPKINLEDSLNGYVLDFYNHGVYKSLVKDNGVREGEVFALLKDFMLVLQTISSSLKQMVREGDEEEDLLMVAFDQLAMSFKLKFDKAFDIRKEYKAKGCYAVHNFNCDACEIIVESSTISGIQGGGKKGVKLRERFTCASSWVVLVVTCKNCKQQFVATCMVTVAAKVKSAGVTGLLGSKHMGHNFGVSIVDRVSAGNLKELEQKKFSWASKLKATDIDIN